ncbi:ATP-grasp domain-containing protein [Paenibacillus alginolyticus]|uniref:carboxylate--amine ligase n=1 Tax=Paenibacillus alginolyticus TaxID=59839 RepID=UPI0003F91B31|nr:ATP-grasp domain-containing protein [Paenibacillus alginolyticus]MCY9664240.1 ATP-grasp domain-containing protein [Paenibacillus alginolyticus]
MSIVLCTNGLLSKTLCVVRSLGSRGIRTITAEKTRLHASGFSKYCSSSVLSPDPGKVPEQYLEWLVDTIRKEHCDVLFPMDDDTLEIVMDNRDLLESLCRVVIPPTESYRIAADKGKTIQVASKLGIPCPQTVEWDDDEIDADILRKRTEHMRYPLLLKPRKSSGSRGIRCVEHPDELLVTFLEVHKYYPKLLIQEMIPQGPKYDVCVCYDAEHRLQASFVQKEVRNYPLDRGPSTVCKSVEYPELLEISKKLMDHLNWYGVADIEFMIDPRSGEPKLMEINPRFWASVPLAVRAGIDFPWLQYQLAIGKSIEPVHTYQVGVYSRSIIPGEILHFISNPKRFQMDPPMWTTKIADDTLSIHDPMPTIGLLLSAARYGWKPETWRFLIRR